MTPKQFPAIDTPCVTRAELIRLSEFTLPAAAVKDLPKGDRAVARRVPGLSYEQVRTCGYYGLFDDVLVKNTRQRGNWILWKPRRRGDTSVYTVRDIATARLVSWMRRDGLTMREIAMVLRGAPMVRATMIAEVADHVYVSRIGRSIDGCVVPAGDTYPPTQFGRFWTFPLAWLGIKNNVLPRVRKMRSVSPNVVWRRRSVPVERVMIMQQEAAERLRQIPRNCGI
jgi:hypothetical protein